MQKIYDDLNTMNTIVRAMEPKQMGMMSQQVSREDIQAEVAIIQAQIKASCKKLLDSMTDDEAAKMTDLTPVIKMFGENMKPDIVKLLRK